MRRPVQRVALAIAFAIPTLLPITSAAPQAPLRAASATPSASPETSATGWRFAITPYAWLIALNGRVGVGPVATNVDLSAGDVLSSLNFGAMAIGEVRHGPWVILTDGIYASLGDSKAIAFRGDTGSFALTQKEVMVQPSAGYTIANETWAIDGLLGARYWHLSTDLRVDGTRRPTSTERSVSRQWVDATGGARIRWRPVTDLDVVAGADGGGGGSRSTWQAYGSVGWDAWHKVNIGLGYRVLSVDYDRSDYLFDTRSYGVTLGATFHL